MLFLLHIPVLLACQYIWLKKTLKSKYCWNIAWFNDTPLDVAVCKQIPNSVKAKSWNTQLSLAVKPAITVVQMVVCTRGATYRQERRHSVHSFPVFYLVYTSTPTSGSCGGPCFVHADSVVLMHVGRGSSKFVSGITRLRCVEVFAEGWGGVGSIILLNLACLSVRSGGVCWLRACLLLLLLLL